jgi:hypothetical protein
MALVTWYVYTFLYYLNISSVKVGTLPYFCLSPPPNFFCGIRIKPKDLHVLRQQLYN